MKIFGKKKENKQDGEIVIIKMALQEALKELEEERNKNDLLQRKINELQKEEKQDYKSLLDSTIKTDKRKIEELRKERDNYKNNLEVLQTTIENIRKMCKDKNGRVISSKEILKELGE